MIIIIIHLVIIIISNTHYYHYTYNISSEGLVFSVVVDTEKPVWTPCPANITRAAVPGTNSVTVSWDVPGVTDNSGETPLQVSTPRTPQLFSGGTHTITYLADDGAGNRGTCQFLVTVTGRSIIMQTSS